MGRWHIMTLSPISCWKQDTARNTFIYTQFLISLPFTLFNTYAIYQLQVTGFLIGTDAQGAPCTTYCLVPFGGGRLDLNSVLLYMNAMTFGLGGFIMIFLTAYADFWSKSVSMYLGNTNKNTIQEHKSVLVTFLIVCYGAFSTPAYWLRSSTLANFNAFIALYVIFGVLTFILIALLNIYIPHCMRQVRQRGKGATPGADTTISQIGRSGSNAAARKYGFAMSVFGTVAVALSAVLMLVIVIAIAKSLPGPGGQSAGLLVTTILGFLTMAGAIPAYFGLPSLPTKPYPEVGGWKIALLELLTPYREIFLRKRNMFFLLLAYTIYTDTLFVLYSITGQLYFIEIKPGTLEYSLYTLAGNLYYFILTIAFYLFQRRFKWDLGKCVIFGYALILMVPIWGCIGLANVNFGYKVSSHAPLIPQPPLDLPNTSQLFQRH